MKRLPGHGTKLGRETPSLSINKILSLQAKSLSADGKHRSLPSNCPGARWAFTVDPVSVNQNKLHFRQKAPFFDGNLFSRSLPSFPSKPLRIPFALPSNSFDTTTDGLSLRSACTETPEMQTGQPRAVPAPSLRAAVSCAFPRLSGTLPSTLLKQLQTESRSVASYRMSQNSEFSYICI